MEENEIILSMPFVGHEDDFKAMGLKCIETKIDRRGINPATDFKLLCTYGRMIGQERPDMVITYSIKPNIYAGIACSILGVPFYANVQGLGTAFQKKGLSQIVTWMYRSALYKAEKVFFENKANAMEFCKRKIVPKTRLRLLHRVILDLVGFFEDEYKEQMEQDGIVVFHGFQENPMPYYTMASCVVLPSYHEGMSNVLLEAAATGIPLITSDIPGCREAVKDGVTGYLCPVKNSKKLYDAMELFVEMPHKEREKMGQDERKRMEKFFDREKVVAETAKIICGGK